MKQCMPLLVAMREGIHLQSTVYSSSCTHKSCDMGKALATRDDTASVELILYSQHVSTYLRKPSPYYLAFHKQYSFTDSTQ